MQIGRLTTLKEAKDNALYVFAYSIVFARNRFARCADLSFVTDSLLIRVIAVSRSRAVLPLPPPRPRTCRELKAGLGDKLQLYRVLRKTFKSRTSLRLP